MQVIQLLQAYPLELTGIENIIDFALHITMRRNGQMFTGPTASKPATMAQTLRNTVWRLGQTGLGSGTTTPTDYATESEEESDHEVRHPHAPPGHQRTGSAGSLGSRLKETMMRGLNTAPLTPVQETVQDDPDRTPSATKFSITTSVWKSWTGAGKTPAASTPAPSEAGSSTDAQSRTSIDSSASTVSTLWSYAERLRDSDAAASLAKAGTNWRIKATEVIAARTTSKDPAGDGHSRAASLGGWGRGESAGYGYSPDRDDQQRNSYPLSRGRPGDRYSEYVPPPMPKFFKPSVTPPGMSSPLMSPRSESMGLPSPETQSRAQSIQAALSALTGVAGAIVTPRSKQRSTGPRPLLLNSSALITPAVASAKSGATIDRSSPTPSGDRWAHVRRESDGLAGAPRGSRSSVGSSVASPILPVRTASPAPMDSDNGRRVPLNRGRRIRTSLASESDADSSWTGVQYRSGTTGTPSRSQRSSIHSASGLGHESELLLQDTTVRLIHHNSDSPPQRPRSAKGWEMVSEPAGSPPLEVNTSDISPPAAGQLSAPAETPLDSFAGPMLTMSAPSPLSPLPYERAPTLSHVGVSLSDPPVPKPVTALAESATLHAEPDSMSDASAPRSSSARRATALSSRKRQMSNDETARAGTMPEAETGAAGSNASKAPAVRRKKYLSHRATASMQHVPSVSEDGVLDTQGGSTGAIARHGHVRKGSTMSRSGTAREHRRTDSNATARKQSLVSPTSAGAARSPTSAGSGRSPTTGGGEEEDAYGGIMLAYERGDE